MHPLLAAALQRASQTGQAVPVTIGSITMTAYPNGQVGGPPGSTTARWTPQQSSLPVPPRPPFSATPSPYYTAGSGSLSGGYVSPDGSYVPPQAIPGVTPSSTANPIIAGSTDPATQVPTPSPAPAGPVDRHDDPVAAQARIYRINHGISTPDDSAATDALNAESLAAARAGRTSFNPQLAAQYGQAPAAGTYGPRTDVVNALSVPTTATGTAYAQQQPIVLAPTTTAAQSAQQRYPMIYTSSQGVPTNVATTAAPVTTMPSVPANLLDPNVRGLY